MVRLPSRLMSSVQTPASEPRFEESRAKVLTFLREEGFTPTEAPPEEEVAWAIRAEMHGPDGKPVQGQPVIGVTQPLGDPERVAVMVSLAFTADDAVNRLSKPTGESLVWELRFLLLALDLDMFSGVDFPFSAVQVAHLCYRETLTRQEFANALRKVRRGCNAVLWTVYRKVGVQPPVNGDTVH